MKSVIEQLAEVATAEINGPGPRPDRKLYRMSEQVRLMVERGVVYPHDLEALANDLDDVSCDVHFMLFAKPRPPKGIKRFFRLGRTVR